jgi:hypothetical protein
MSSVTVGGILPRVPASHAKEQVKRIAEGRGEVHRKRSLHRPELGRVKVKKSCKGNMHLYAGSFMMLLHIVTTETWLLHAGRKPPFPAPQVLKSGKKEGTTNTKR